MPFRAQNASPSQTVGSVSSGSDSTPTRPTTVSYNQSEVHTAHSTSPFTSEDALNNFLLDHPVMHLSLTFCSFGTHS